MKSMKSIFHGRQWVDGDARCQPDQSEAEVFRRGVEANAGIAYGDDWTETAEGVCVSSMAGMHFSGRNGADHHAAVKFEDSLPHPLVTSNHIADEVITLVRNRLGYKVAVEIGQKLWDESIANLIYVTPQDEKKAWEIFVQYRDKNFSFTGCTSFALMKRIGITEVFAFDEHFKQYGNFIALPLASGRFRSRRRMGDGDH